MSKCVFGFFANFIYLLSKLKKRMKNGSYAYKNFFPHFIRFRKKKMKIRFAFFEAFNVNAILGMGKNDLEA